ncbi:cellulase family glycosylhydrolase [Paenibacillus methanolicus]|uniref:Aryl-phospho-beta-D-glucosidase BglC (GH1 family) n=1 Tax=Paenibacillus methanolicus TaxID=582686 RepID=A0A5S5CFJ8_9BACL|nr:cellulase family glycosylhydrolase [Paenibacillus methanolicus]TYP78181.1 aryl-phospho-beta-D-glucosidase BglC (GH1 family) [Paenibacillus methanolicus]
MPLLRRPRHMLVLTLLLLVAMLTPAVASASDGAERERDKDRASGIQSYVKKMQPGWNLGNTFDATGADETSWGNPRVTKSQIKAIAKQGFNSIRIPVTWQQHMGGAPDYSIDPAFLDRVEEVVDWSLDEGLYVMINLHHDSWLWVTNMGTEHDEVLARYNAAWTQIADRFKNYSTKLSFESINEPRFTSGWGEDSSAFFTYLAELNTSFHEIVRASGGKNDVRPLVLPTLETNASQDRLDQLYGTIQSLNDPNLIATVHYYGFWPFSVNIAGFTRFEEQTQKDITDTFDRVYDSFVAKGIPVILGEFGLLGFDKNTGTIEQGEKLKFFEFLIDYLNQKNITHMLWDNGQHFDRLKLTWKDQQLFDLMKASWKGRSATAASDLIFLKQGADIQDASVTLNLNGNKLSAIRAGKDKLKKGRDYELSGDTLTFKAALLKKLTASGQLGENAELVAEFNKGADWTFDVITYKAPTLASAEGTSESFAIPTAFNGDRLATMEAVYAVGGNAGPQNWTSFKEFGYAFTPDYAAGTVVLPANFFNEVNDGVVNLKLHFWSGEIVNYTIAKQGASVTGTAS